MWEFVPKKISGRKKEGLLFQVKHVGGEVQCIAVSLAVDCIELPLEGDILVPCDVVVVAGVQCPQDASGQENVVGTPLQDMYNPNTTVLHNTPNTRPS